MNSSVIKAFYAFPSKPASLKETILLAVDVINKKNIVKILPWTELNPNGKVIISQILKRIDESDLFLCDISGLNPNVCFELGYAIAKNKRVWLTYDKSDSNNIELIKKFNIIQSIGHEGFLNDNDLVKAFFKQQPYSETEESILQDYKTLIENHKDSYNFQDILFFKSIIDHTASSKLTKFIEDLKRKTITIDYLENSYQPLETTLINILRSKIFIAHLLSNKMPNNQIMNSKYSFFAGLAVGFDKKTLLIAPVPYETPLDYKDILLLHETANSCVEQVKDWIFPILSRGEIIPKKDKGDEKELLLLRFALGDGQAEHEENELSDFFVKTSQYNIALNSTMGIFIGRKGTGKTTNLFEVRDHFLQNNTNLVIIIKPLSFRLEAYVKLINNYFKEIDIQSELTEKIWEFVIFSTIAFELYEQINNKPAYYELKSEEIKFKGFVENNLNVINNDFGDKINYIYDETEKLFNAGENPKKILQVVFDKFISDIKRMLNAILKKYTKIIILVDNLDKAWDFSRDVESQCKIIFGLIGLQNSLKKTINNGNSEIRLLIFLREDIFNHVKKIAREPDKILLSTHRIEWNDKELLLRVIEERFIFFDNNLNHESVWTELFCQKINNIPIRDYIYSIIIPRPRDLIYFVYCAINESINHQHNIIQESDLKKSQKDYFEFLLANTTTEYQLFYPRIKDLILSFYGSKEKIHYSTLQKKIKKYTCTGYDIDEIVKLLINISFIGIEINNIVQFAFNDLDTEKLYNYYLSEKKKIFKSINIKIHPAYYSGLQQI